MMFIMKIFILIDLLVSAFNPKDYMEKNFISSTIIIRNFFLSTNVYKEIYFQISFMLYLILVLLGKGSF
jgi:hypothetical protein